MTYFRQLPNIEYQNFLENSTGSQDYVLMKNIFLRGKLRDDLQNNFTAFNKYIIMEDERPDQVANKLYEDPGLDWVVLIVAGITNFQNDWPLTSQQFYDYIVKKYGEENINNTAFYETTEVKNNFNEVILKSGIQVNKEFTIPDPNIPTSTINPTTGISYSQYEGRVNDDKREIYVLREVYIDQFLRDMRSISKYGFNSEFINPTTIRASNSKTTSP